MSDFKIPSHYISLGDFGGLQTLYSGFARDVLSRGLPLHTINRSNVIHPQFAGQFGRDQSRVASPEDVPILAFIPRAMRRTRRRIQRSHLNKVIGLSGLERVVCWNAPPERYMKRNGRQFVFYDHGYSSIRSATRERRSALSVMQGAICVSKANERLLRDVWQFGGPVRVVQNPLRQNIANQKLRPKVGLSRCIRIACASRLVSFKGIASVIHAVSSLRQLGYPVHLSVAGVGPELCKLEEIARKHLPEDSFRFLGLVGDMNALFGAADIFVAPSLREPFGLSPLEALASGVPTVLSNIDGHPEVLPFDGAAVLVEPDFALSDYASLGASLNDIPEYVYFPSTNQIAQPKAISPETLASALISVIEDYPRHAEIAASAARQIRHKYHMEKYTDALLSVFGELF